MPEIQEGRQFTDEQLKALVDESVSAQTADIPGFTAEKGGGDNEMGNILAAIKNNIPLSKEQLKKAFVAANQEPGIPLDVERGAATAERFFGSFGDQDDARFAYWESKYPGFVRKATNGDIIYRVLDDQGKPKDMLVNDYKNLSLGDVAEIGGTMPEMAGSFIGALSADFATGGKGGALQSFGKRALKFLGISFGSAVGAGVGGLAEDVFIRTKRGLNVELKSRVGERAAQIPVDMLMDYTLAGMARLGSKVISPARSAAEEFVVQGRKASDELGVPLSSGERSNLTFVQGIESLLSNVQGSDAVFKEFKAKQAEALGRAQKKLVGDTYTGSYPTLEKTVKEVEEAIANANEPAVKALMKSRRDTISKLVDSINKTLDDSTTPKGYLYKGESTKVLKGAAKVRRKNFQDTSSNLYGAAYSLPGGKQDILVDPVLAQEAKNMLENELPTRDIIETIDTGLLDPTMTAIIRKEGKKVPDRPFVPSKVLSYLESLSSGGDQARSLEKLVAMRTAVSDSIAEGEAIAGVTTHQLKKIRNMLTESIVRSTSKIKDGKLKKAWETANNHYAKEYPPFELPLIQKLLKDVGDPGYIADADLAGHIARGDASLKEIGQFFGETSQEYALLKKTIGSHVLREADNTFTGLINAETLLNSLKSFRESNREAYDIIFGDKATKIINDATLIKISQSDKISAEAFKRGMEVDGKVEILDLIQKDRDLQKQAQNQFRKIIGSKTYPGSGFAEKQFVNRIVDSAAPEQVKEFMDLLPADVANKVRFNVVMKVLRDADRAAKGSDVFIAGFDLMRPVNVEGLEAIFKDENKRLVIQNILGEESVGRLKKIGQAQRLLNQSSNAASASGGLIGGSQRADFIGLKWGKLIHKWAGQILIAEILTNQKVSKLLANNVFSPERMATIYAGLAASSPLLEKIGKDAGLDIASMFQGQVNNMAQLGLAIEQHNLEIERERQFTDEQLFKLLP